MEKTRKTLQLPHNCEAILKDADSPVNKSSMDNLVSQLHAGVFLNQKRKKYWVDKKLNKNCFMLFARELSITWGGDYRYWHWCYQKDTTSDEYIEVAELLQVCWLEVHTKFDIAKLSPGTLYQVVAMVMLRDEAYGWEDPVNFRLTLPNGHKVERKETLMNKPKGLWIEIPVGEFTTSSGNSGELDIYFHEYTAGTWKGGLILKGVAILPKN
ncbi:Phloem protein 2-like protein [Corchorus olitorius]|uniref:Phloem protein 2-like protein n=1 Tax=Corchorus olitorius TaxID=93759 RepID=A0A1R3H630_9ROSI|nr:Phloem protein 2-like protein [Corchorus olitorius]